MREMGLMILGVSQKLLSEWEKGARIIFGDLPQVWGPRQNLELRTKLIQPMEPDAFNMWRSLFACFPFFLFLRLVARLVKAALRVAVLGAKKRLEEVSAPFSYISISLTRRWTKSILMVIETLFDIEIYLRVNKITWISNYLSGLKSRDTDWGNRKFHCIMGQLETLFTTTQIFKLLKTSFFSRLRKWQMRVNLKVSMFTTPQSWRWRNHLVYIHLILISNLK